MPQDEETESTFNAQIPREPLKILIADDLPSQIDTYRYKILPKIRAHFHELRSRFGSDVLIPEFTSYFSRSLNKDYADTLDDGTSDTRSKPVDTWFKEEPGLEFDLVVTDLKFHDPDSGEEMGHKTTGLDILDFVRSKQKNVKPVFILVTAWESEMIGLGRNQWLPILSSESGENRKYLDPRNFIGKDLYDNPAYIQARIEYALSEAEIHRLARAGAFSEPYSLTLIVENRVLGEKRRNTRSLTTPMPPPPKGMMGVLIQHRVSNASICFGTDDPDHIQFLWVLAHNTDVNLNFKGIEKRLNTAAPKTKFARDGNTIAFWIRSQIKEHATRIVHKHIGAGDHLCSSDSDAKKLKLHLVERTPAQYDQNLPICPCCLLALRRNRGFRILAPSNLVKIEEVHDIDAAIAEYQRASVS